jgi:hypothetical protein
MTIGASRISPSGYRDGFGDNPRQLGLTFRGATESYANWGLGGARDAPASLRLNSDAELKKKGPVPNTVMRRRGFLRTSIPNAARTVLLRPPVPAT